MLATKVRTSVSWVESCPLKSQHCHEVGSGAVKSTPFPLLLCLSSCKHTPCLCPHGFPLSVFMHPSSLSSWTHTLPLSVLMHPSHICPHANIHPSSVCLHANTHPSSVCPHVLLHLSSCTLATPICKHLMP